MVHPENTTTTAGFSFGKYELDLQKRCLTLKGVSLDLRPKSFDVLALLVRNAGTSVEREAIFKAVWPGLIVSGDSLAHCIGDIREALADDEKQLILTIPGRGYQFAANARLKEASPDRSISHRTSRHWLATALVASVLVLIIGIVASSLGNDDESRTLLTHQPSIAVIPFQNVTSDPEIQPFVEGLGSDLITALARVPELLVISQNSARHFSKDAVDVPSAATVLGVNHILTGSVQRNGNDLRIFVELASGADATTIWSRRYDRSLSHFLELQDDIVRNVLVELQVELTHGDTVQYLSHGTTDLEAWLANFEGYSEGFKFTIESNQRARRLFETASLLDPNWAMPVAGMAWTYREDVRRGWSNDPGSDRKAWLHFATKCLEIDSTLSFCYNQLGNYYIENGQVEKGLELREHSLSLAPNDLSALSGLAWPLILVGEVERGLELLQRAKLVSPIHPPWLYATEAYGYQMDGQLDKAAEGFQKALELGNFPDWHARLAAVYMEAGDVEKAREEAAKFTEKSPNRTISDLTKILEIQEEERTRHYEQLLRQAGVPD